MKVLNKVKNTGSILILMCPYIRLCQTWGWAGAGGGVGVQGHLGCCCWPACWSQMQLTTHTSSVGTKSLMLLTLKPTLNSSGQDYDGAHPSHHLTFTSPHVPRHAFTHVSCHAAVACRNHVPHYAFTHVSCQAHAAPLYSPCCCGGGCST